MVGALASKESDLATSSGVGHGGVGHGLAIIWPVLDALVKEVVQMSIIVLATPHTSAKKRLS